MPFLPPPFFPPEVRRAIHTSKSLCVYGGRSSQFRDSWMAELTYPDTERIEVRFLKRCAMILHASALPSSEVRKSKRNWRRDSWSMWSALKKGMRVPGGASAASHGLRCVASNCASLRSKHVTLRSPSSFRRSRGVSGYCK